MIYLFLAAWTGVSHAETADEIIAKAQAANRVDSSIQTIKMTIVAKGGAERVKEVELRTRREGEVVKTYMKLLAPSDVAGTQMLLVDNPGKIDEQLLYLPAYKRVNRVSGTARKGSFVGSDFTFEDFEVREAAVGTHTLVSEDPTSWTIDTAMSGDTAYTKIRSVIGKADLVVSKIEFYDASGLLKVLSVKKTQKEGSVNLPVETEMANVQKGTKTLLTITGHQMNVDKTVLPDDTFTQAFLERGQ